MLEGNCGILGSERRLIGSGVAVKRERGERQNGERDCKARNHHGGLQLVEKRAAHGARNLSIREVPFHT